MAGPDVPGRYPTGRALAQRPRRYAFAVVSACYLVAAVLAGVVAWLLRAHHPLTATLAADVVATVVIFGLSMLVANSSLYDPYWSVAPPLVATAWLLTALLVPVGTAAPPGAGGWSRRALVVLLVWVWALRLTGNWASGWRGFAHEDWRYVQLRERSTRRVPWWLVSLTGIQLMPTLVVFLGMLPLWPALTGPGGFGLLDMVAVATLLGAVLLEATADRQLRRFAAGAANRGRSLATGVWACSRHPNYLGEILFWWGLWLAGIAADPSWWWTIVGPLGMVVLFNTVSIPMMESRLSARRPDHPEVVVRVPRLVPVPWLAWQRRRSPRPGG